MLSYRVSVRLIACVLFTALTATVGAAQQRTDFGTLSVQVRPPDAEIFIDGERWTGPDGPGPLEVQRLTGHPPCGDPIARPPDVRAHHQHSCRGDVAVERVADAGRAGRPAAR